VPSDCADAAGTHSIVAVIPKHATKGRLGRRIVITCSPRAIVLLTTCRSAASGGFITLVCQNFPPLGGCSGLLGAGISSDLFDANQDYASLMWRLTVVSKNLLDWLEARCPDR